jgi:hypothetical protein
MRKSRSEAIANSLVMHRWLSLPVGGAAALLFIMAEEKSSGLQEVD